jgi:hypothetical protein
MAQAFEDGSFPGPQVSSYLQSLTDRRVNVATTPPNQALQRTALRAAELLRARAKKSLASLAG